MTVDVSEESKPFWMYRLQTIWNSFKFLYTLSKEKMDAYVASYEIFDQDWERPQDMERAVGKEYERVLHTKIVDCYSILTHLCAIGHVEKMYIPPAMDLTKNILENQILFERYLSDALELKAGKKVLELGCGRGRIANHIVTYSGAHVTGMNIDPSQISSARAHAKRTSKEHLSTFLQASFNDFPFPFPDNSFDAVYEVQACSYSKDLEGLFREIYRVMKPGAKIGFIEWGALDAYDPSNPRHAHLMRLTKQVIEAVWSPKVSDYVDAMKKAGFVILKNENLSIDGLQSPLIKKAHTFYVGLAKWIRFLAKCRILPKHFPELFARLSKGGDEFIAADEERLVTTSHYILAEKPLSR